MKEAEIREEIVATGKELLEKELVARTWGNISERADENSFLITPSGLSYLQTEPEDISLYRMEDDSWEGRRKPSSEKGIHKAAYQLFPDVNFVIHTHQNFATALSLAGWKNLKMTPEEAEKLDGVGRAGYGLPGTKKLWNQVTEVLKQGNHVVLMAHHGALVCGKDKADAMEKVQLLEEVCSRAAQGLEGREPRGEKKSGLHRVEEGSLLKEVQAQRPGVMLFSSEAILKAAARQRPIKAQLDDMAQMIGRKIPLAKKDAKEILRALEKCNVVLVPGVGVFALGQDAEDTEALGLLTEKAAIAALHAEGCGAAATLPLFDVLLMRRVYLNKYSKLKDAEKKEAKQL